MLLLYVTKAVGVVVSIVGPFGSLVVVVAAVVAVSIPALEAQHGVLELILEPRVFGLERHDQLFVRLHALVLHAQHRRRRNPLTCASS